MMHSLLRLNSGKVFAMITGTCRTMSGRTIDVSSLCVECRVIMALGVARTAVASLIANTAASLSFFTPRASHTTPQTTVTLPQEP